MADSDFSAKDEEDAWPVTEEDSAKEKTRGKKEGAGEDDRGEFLLNLLSTYSRKRLLPLADLPREDLIHAFL